MSTTPALTRDPSASNYLRPSQPAPRNDRSTSSSPRHSRSALEREHRAASPSRRSQVQINRLGLTTIVNPPANPVADVVFVHGLQGDPQKTWTYTGDVVTKEPEPNQVKTSCCMFSNKASAREGIRTRESIFWPRDLLPEARNDVRLMTYGYDSHISKFFSGAANQTNISEHGRSFLSSLSSERVGCPRRPLIFVAHSLGGLIVKEALRRSREERHHDHLKGPYRSTFAIIFFGTPHRGSSDAAWGEMLRRIASAAQFDTAKPILADLDPSSGSAKLDELSEAFSDMLDEKGFCIYSFQESHGKVDVRHLRQLVVPKESSALNERKYEIKESINANHMNMCKFKGRDDDGYKKFLFALNLYVNKILEDNGQARQESAQGPQQPPGVLRNVAMSKNPHARDGKELRDNSEGQGQSRTFIVPYTSNPDFVGRSAILQRLKHHFPLRHQQKAVTSQARAALWGLGGIGKTQIALAYVFWVQQVCPEVSVFWVHAATSEQFHESFKQIAQKCQIPLRGGPRTDVPMLVKNWLESSERSRRQWLMIIDNADDTEIFFNSNRGMLDEAEDAGTLTSNDHLARYLPDCPHGSILLTTKDKQAAVKFARNRACDIIKVGELAESDQLIKKKLGKPWPSSTDVSLLSVRLESIPLAVVQATAYIQEREIDIPEYLRLLDQSDQSLVELLSKPFEEVGRDSSVPNAVAATWIISFKVIRDRHRDASDLLSLLSSFDWQGIPKSFLSRYSNKHYRPDSPRGRNPEIRLTEALGVLKAFSFVSIDQIDRFVNMHRLVYLVTRNWLVEERISERWAAEAFSIVSGSLLTPLDCDRHFKYLRSAWTVLDHNASRPWTSFTRLSPVSQSLWELSWFTEWAWERLLSTRFEGYGPGWGGSNATEQAAYRLELTASVRQSVLQSKPLCLRSDADCPTYLNPGQNLPGGDTWGVGAQVSNLTTKGWRSDDQYHQSMPEFEQVSIKDLIERRRQMWSKEMALMMED